MTAYNAERFLRPAIDSILAQTCTDFELILVDDGSTDDTPHIISSYDDPRIIVLTFPQNKGLIIALNTGIDRAQGQYIARMDTDDISDPHRFALQYDYMEKHLEIAVCGSFMQDMSADGHLRGIITYPRAHQEIRVTLLWRCALGHPTIFLRRSVVEKHAIRYREADKHAEDYGLWISMSNRFLFANIPQPLVRYRDTPDSITRTRCPIILNETQASLENIHRDHLKKLLGNLTKEEYLLHRALIERRLPPTLPLKPLLDFSKKIVRSNQQKKRYPHDVLTQHLFQRLTKIYERTHQLPAISAYIHSGRLCGQPISYWKLLRITLLALLPLCVHDCIRQQRRTPTPG